MWPIILLLAVSLSGCSSLLLHPSDTTAEKTGKIAIRTLLALPTLFLSEVALDQRAREDAYAAWYWSLTDAGRDREDRRQARNTPTILFMPQLPMPYQLPMAPTPPPSAIRPPVTCQTYTLGTTYQTACY